MREGCVRAAPRTTAAAEAENKLRAWEGEREAVLNCFYRSQRTWDLPGSAWGLSIVAAIARLHHFALSLEDAEPGLRIALDCWPRGLETWRCACCTPVIGRATCIWPRP